MEFSRPYGDKVKPRRTHPSGTGFVDRLYELRGLPPELAQQVEENIFRPVDTRAADVLEDLHAGHGPRNARDRMAWTQFLVSMLMRNPEELRSMKESYARHWRLSNKKYERKYQMQRRESDPPTFAKYLAATPDTFVELQAMKAFVSSLSAERTSKHIFRMKWGHFEIPFTAPALLTSDRPLVTEGFTKEDSYLVMPIGPKRIFYAVNTHATSDRLMMLSPNELVQRVNLAVTVHANKFVYAASDHAIDFVQRHMSADPALPMSTRFGTDHKIRKLRRRDMDMIEKMLSEH